jgi:hypothetical protein
MYHAAAEKNSHVIKLFKNSLAFYSVILTILLKATRAVAEIGEIEGCVDWKLVMISGSIEIN